MEYRLETKRDAENKWHQMETSERIEPCQAKLNVMLSFAFENNLGSGLSPSNKIEAEDRKILMIGWINIFCYKCTNYETIHYQIVRIGVE